MKKTFLLICILTIPFFGFSTIVNNPASMFLNTLNQEQKEKALLSFEDATRTTWHFLPATMWKRPGISLKELNNEQKKSLFQLLRSYLSETGHSKVLKIIDLENVLLEQSNNATMRDSENYYATFYGNPGKDALWAWSFEGHHISLNFTISNHVTSMTPRFLGSNPAIVIEGKRKGERTLAREDDLGLKLINSLSNEQKLKAIFSKQSFQEIVTKNDSKVTPLKIEGIIISDLTNKQQSLLLNLIEEYVDTMPSALAAERMNILKKEELSNLHFGWAGATILGKPHYYRIQGKTFLIEFDNTQNNANHIHTVWRDFDGDFGEDLIKLHYQKSDHHH